MANVMLDDARAAQILGWMADHLRRFPKEYEAAKIVTLNRVGTKVKTAAIKILTSRYAAKRADIARKITASKASTARPFAAVRGQGRPLHLGLWPRKTVKLFSLRNRQKLQGVKVQILKGSGFKPVQGAFGAGALVFRRKGENRYPIEALYGPSMIGHLTHDENLEPLLELGRTALETELTRQAQFRLGRIGIL